MSLNIRIRERRGEIEMSVQLGLKLCVHLQKERPSNFCSYRRRKGVNRIKGRKGVREREYVSMLVCVRMRVCQYV